MTRQDLQALTKTSSMPLENEWGFIEVEKIGRNRWIKLTKEGEHASEFYALVYYRLTISHSFKPAP